MTKYISETMDMMDLLLVIIINCEKTVIYLEKLFCQIMKILF